MRISEKTLELNVGAELLNYLRNTCGLPKIYLRGLTQREESQEGVDIFAQMSPSTRIAAFQFKAPRSSEDCSPYNFRIQRVQHSNLHRLASINPNSVFYVLPFYASHSKFQRDIPNLLQDTWFLPIERMATDVVFNGLDSRTVHCYSGFATINPELQLFTAEELKINRNTGIPVWQFAIWYRELHELKFSVDSYYAGKSNQRIRRNPWLVRGMRIAIIST